MKIILINVVYGKGSTGSITKSLYTGYKKLGHDVKVIYGRYSDVTDEPKINKYSFELESKFCHLASKVSGNLYGGMHLSTYRIIKEIKRYKPDLIHLHCLNGYFVNIYRLISFIAILNCKVIMTMHADFMMTGGCGYAVNCTKYLTCECKKCPVIKEFNGKLSFNRTRFFYKKMNKAVSRLNIDKLTITCVSPWLMERYKKAPIYNKYKVVTVLNPVDDIFFTKRMFNPYKTANNILYVTPDIFDKEKSGYLIERVAEKLTEYTFTIICAKKISYKPKSRNIIYISGGVDHKTLRDYYAYADITLLLSKRETFSMVVAESLSCGTPVVGFECGGAESIAIKEYSSFSQYGDINLLVKNILYFKNVDNRSQISSVARNIYCLENIVDKYLKL